MMAAECGTRLELEARGPDADAAVEALAELVSARFYEDEDGEPIDGRATGSGAGPMSARDHGPPDRRASARRSPRRRGRTGTGGSSSRGSTWLGSWHAAFGDSQSDDAHRTAADAGPAGDRHQPGDRPGPGGGAGSARPGACRPARSPRTSVAGELDRLDRGLDVGPRGGRAGTRPRSATGWARSTPRSSRRTAG